MDRILSITIEKLDSPYLSEAIIEAKSYFSNILKIASEISMHIFATQMSSVKYRGEKSIY